MKRHSVDVVAKAHVVGTWDGRGDHQIGAGKQRIIGEVMFREPALTESQGFRQDDLIQHLMIRLIMRYAPPLTIVEKSKVHACLLMVIGVEHTRPPSLALVEENLSNNIATQGSRHHMLAWFRCQPKCSIVGTA